MKRNDSSPQSNVSVVVPFRVRGVAAAHWARECLESALLQTDAAGRPAEVIAVENDSDAAGRELAEEFSDRMTIMPSPKNHACAARNAGWRAARGRWVQFLDCDDSLHEGKTRQQAILGEGFEAVCGPVVCAVHETDSLEESPTMIADLKWRPQEDLFQAWFSWRFAHTAALLWRRETLDKLGGWREELPCGQDNDLTARALRMGVKFLLSPDTPPAVYRFWSSATISSNDPRSLIEVKTRLIDAMTDWLEERAEMTQERRDAAGQLCFQMARSLAVQDQAAAAEYVRQRRRRNLLRIEGPAAPRAYRLLAKTLGFRFAERVANFRRTNARNAPE